jgi:hypothetical protein
MAIGIPYYSIVGCCSSSGTALDYFNFPIGEGLPPEDGVYRYTGPEITINGITFSTSACYTITQIGSVFATFPVAPSINNFQLTTNCEDAKCECEKVPTYYTLNDCCTNIPINWPPNEGGLLQGTLYLEFDGTSCNEGEFNDTPCPNNLTNLIITEIVNEAGLSVTGCLKLTSFSITEIPVGADIVGWENIVQAVETVPTCEDCQDCKKTVDCYTLYPCDNTRTPINTQNINIAPYVGEFISLFRYTGCWYVTLNESGICQSPIDVEANLEIPCACAAKCYLITGAPDVVTYVNIDGDLVTTSGSTKICSLIYPIVSGGSSSGVIYESGTCSTGQCNDLCFTLTDCNDDTNILESNTQSLLSYIGLDSVIKINGYDTCWKVDFKTTCECVILIFNDEGGQVYDITLNVITTFDGRNVYSDADGEIFLWWDADSNEWVITSEGYGSDADEVYAVSINLDVDCPESIESQWDSSMSLKLYINSINPCLVPCECPIPVTVLQSFTTCEACLPVIAYKFISCLNPSIIKYSIDDYSIYVGKVVKLKCGDCWTVEQINYTPPSVQTIDILFTYDSCSACAKTYYKLTNCLDPLDILYTGSVLNLSASKTSKIDVGPNPAPTPTDCDCISITYQTKEGSQLITIQVLKDGQLSYTFDIDGIEYILSYITEDAAWLLQESGNKIAVLDSDSLCPFGTYATFLGKEGNYLYSFSVAPCTKTTTVVKIKECEGCWIAEEIDYPEGPITAATVVLEFKDCDECEPDIPCQCSTMTNNDLVTKTYLYLDCDYNYVEVTLNPGETSNKVCAIAWLKESYCDCFIVKRTDLEDPSSSAIIANANGDMLNGYPVYDLCERDRCGTVSFNGTNWVIYDPNGDPLYILQTLTSGSCPFGTWVREDGQPIPNVTIESYECPITCNCINLTVTGDQTSQTINLTIGLYNDDGYPIYVSQDDLWSIKFSTKLGCWTLSTPDNKGIIKLCNTDCPVGTWDTGDFSDLSYTSTDCTIPPSVTELTSTDCIETYGLCKFGICPPPVFINNRTVRPGYNTPNCNPDEYDKITCRFADVMYKVVLEKRYGITNCCPDEDEKWLLKKELIDLQAIRDPNYKCEACGCPCNSGKSYSSCNCGN